MKDVVLRFTHIVACILLPFYRLSMGSIGASLMAQMVKNLPAMWDTWVWEDPLEKGMAVHSVFLPGESHGQRNLVGYKLDTTE